MKINNKIIRLKQFIKQIVMASEARQSQQMACLKAKKPISLLLALTIILSIFLVAVPMAGIAEATDYYVDPDGTDDASHGTSTGTDAFKTIQYAINDSRVVAGDTISVAAGTYDEQVTVDKVSLTLISSEFQTSGATTKNTTLINAGGGVGSKGVSITANGVTVQGFTIHNYENGVYVENSTATIDNCIIYNTDITVTNPPRGINASLTQASNSSVTITNNKIYDNVLGGSWTDSGGRGINVSSDSAGAACGVLIDNNEIYGNDHRGISLAHIGGTISGNNIHNNGVYGSGRNFIVGILLAYTGGTVDVSGNTVNETEAGSGMGAGVYIFSPAENGIINIDDNDILATNNDPNIEVNREYSTGTINITNNRIKNGLSAHGAGIVIGNQSTDTEARVEKIEGNDISSNAAGGICLWYKAVVGSIANNTISNNGLAEIPQTEAGNNYGTDGIGTITDVNNKYPYEIEEIKNNTITNNFGYGVKLSEHATANTVISGNTISGNGEDGIWCKSSTFSPLINYNNICNNSGYGVNNLESAVTIDATNNWWGDASGPKQANTNPSATGDEVSDNVDYAPWYTDEAMTTLSNADATLSDLTVDGTTIAGFDSSTLIYDKELPYGTTIVPTVAATTTDSKATKEITQAANLTGTEAQRTATVVVTAEDGTTTKTYKVIFGFIKVTITKTGPTTANQGNNIIYTITYKNVGTFNATNVIVTETYPSEVEYRSATPAPNTGNNQWTIGTLASGAEGTITVTVHIK